MEEALARVKQRFEDEIPFVRFLGVELETLRAGFARLRLPYRVDFIVENCLVVEIKCVEKVLPVHEAQLLSYLKLSGYRLGLLINFNVPHLRDGIHRKINGPEADL